jgi:hypothetical protein
MVLAQQLQWLTRRCRAVVEFCKAVVAGGHKIILLSKAMSLRGGFSERQDSSCRDSKCRKTCVCEHIGVAVAHFEFDPTVFDSSVQSSLKITVSYFNEFIASNCATRANFMSRKNAEDLAAYFLIGWDLGHSPSFALQRALGTVIVRLRPPSLSGPP